MAQKYISWVVVLYVTVHHLETTLSDADFPPKDIYELFPPPPKFENFAHRSSDLTHGASAVGIAKTDLPLPGIRTHRERDAGNHYERQDNVPSLRRVPFGGFPIPQYQNQKRKRSSSSTRQSMFGHYLHSIPVNQRRFELLSDDALSLNSKSSRKRLESQNINSPTAFLHKRTDTNFNFPDIPVFPTLPNWREMRDRLIPPQTSSSSPLPNRRDSSGSRQSGHKRLDQKRVPTPPPPPGKPFNNLHFTDYDMDNLLIKLQEDPNRS